MGGGAGVWEGKGNWSEAEETSPWAQRPTCIVALSQVPVWPLKTPGSSCAVLERLEAGACDKERDRPTPGVGWGGWGVVRLGISLVSAELGGWGVGTGTEESEGHRFSLLAPGPSPQNGPKSRKAQL